MKPMDANNDNIVGKPPLADETPYGKSGLILCALTNLAPIPVGKGREGRRAVSTISGGPKIAARFLDEMLRVRADAAGRGCGGADAAGRPGEKRAACDTVRRLCIVCRLFGMTGAGYGAGEHRGNVKVSDGIVREDKSTVNEVRAATTDDAGRAASLPPGLRFHFDVQFSNLRREELELLIHALTLEDPAMVEIETGGPASTGRRARGLRKNAPRDTIACRLSIDELIYFAPFKSRGAAPPPPKSMLFQGDALKNELSLLTHAVIEDGSHAAEHFPKRMAMEEDIPVNAPPHAPSEFPPTLR